MSRKHSRQSAAAPSPTDRGRRSFLAKSVAGGVSAPLVLCGAEPARAAADAPCDVQATALEAIIALKDIVNGLQGAVYNQSVKDLGGAVRQTTDYFGELCAKVRQLKGELVKARKGTEHERMQAMAEVGCTGAGQIEHFSDVGKVRAHMALLDGISKQIRKMAHELLPEGQGVTLSAEATNVLREIIILVDEQTVAVRQRLLAALANARRAVDEVEVSTQRVHARLSAAINEMHKPKSAEATAALLAQAVDELKRLRGMLTAHPPSAEKADLLITLTEGTRQWVAGEHAASADAGAAPVFRKAAYRRGPAAPAPAAEGGEVYNLIAQFYPPEGWFKAGRCLILLTQLKLGLKFRSAAREEVVDLVRRGLHSYSITCSEWQGRACDRERFVQELARIVLR